MADEKKSGVCNICGPRMSMWFGKCCDTHDCFMCLECRNALHGAPIVVHDEKGNDIPPSTYNIRMTADGEVVARIEFVDGSIQDFMRLFEAVIYGVRDENEALSWVKFAHGRSMILKDEVREIVEKVRDRHGPWTRDNTPFINHQKDICDQILEAIDGAN